MFRGQCKTGILLFCQQLYKVLVCLYLLTQNAAQERIGFRRGYALSKGTATDYGCSQNKSNLRVEFHFTFSIKKKRQSFSGTFKLGLKTGLSVKPILFKN